MEQANRSKIVERMLERLHAALASGPLLSCRPHRSRQRIDLTQLGQLEGPRPEQIVPALLAGERAVRLTLPRSRPSQAESDGHGSANGGNGSTSRRDNDEQDLLLAKLRAIAEDAKTYEQDTGAHALFVGYPILHLPPDARGRAGGAAKRVLAPVAFIFRFSFTSR